MQGINQSIIDFLAVTFGLQTLERCGFSSCLTIKERK